jgi:hypothetical protein
LGDGQEGIITNERQIMNQGGPDTPTTDGRANLPVCPNLTASQRSNAGGTMGIRTPEHRSARSGESLGGVAAPPYLGGVKLRPGWVNAFLTHSTQLLCCRLRILKLENLKINYEQNC